MTQLLKTDTQRLIVIDSRVTDWKSLIGDDNPETTLLVLDPARDGLTQISEAVANSSNLDAIHILSHGSSGSVLLGSTTLNNSNLSNYQTQLTTIGNALSTNSDILLYGCDVARGDAGLQFINVFAQYTGADVAASDDLTGSAVQGGDWLLEANTGMIETASFSDMTYDQTLGLTVTPNVQVYNHALGEWPNVFAFAVVKVDGSVVTWGDINSGGDNSSVAAQLNGSTDVMQIFSTNRAFAALRADGSVVTWGDLGFGGDSSHVAAQLNGTNGVTQIFSVMGAFAALHADGSVVTWGSWSGGDSSSVAAQLDGTTDVTQIFSTGYAFAALRADGSVVTWGDSSLGGNSSSVAAQLDGTTDVTQIFSTPAAFAALRADGSVVTWGYEYQGGYSDNVATQLDGTIDVTQIFSTLSAFAALRADGSVVTWGLQSDGGDSSAVAGQLDGTNDVTQIFSTMGAFAALHADGSVVTWGGSGYGGDSSSVATQLDGTNDVTQIFSTDYAFAALRADGSVVTWGHSSFGGDSSNVATQLDGTTDVTQIFSTGSVFAALRVDGSVVTWGGVFNDGGDSSSVATQLDGTIDVTQIFSTDYAFAALRADGSVVTWGNTSYGGDSSSVASQLTSGVVWAANISTNDIFTSDTSPSPTADLLKGGIGDDTHIVDHLSDIVVEEADQGTDLIQSTVNYVVSANVENLTLLGTDNLFAVGNSLNNTLTGNAGNNFLDGWTGTDYLWGWVGDDSYVVDDTNDFISENINEGNDLVYANVSYTLSANVENLVLYGNNAINGTGNTSDNLLVGNFASNNLTGGLGKDVINVYEEAASRTTDTITVMAGDSLFSGFDQVYNFQTGLGDSNIVDRLDLTNATIAANTNMGIDGIDINTIRSHFVTNGYVVFDDTNSLDPNSLLTIDGSNLVDALGYLQANITDGSTVAFTGGISTFVFQDGGDLDTLVELVGVGITGLSLTGNEAGSIWLV